MIKQNKTIGLIGGMGPYASAYFYKLLLEKSSDNYGAKNNDDFPEILIDSVPVPDFISDISKLKVAKNMLMSRIEKMNDYGIGNIGMICNTGHILYKDLSNISGAKFYSMIDLVADEISKRGFGKVGVLATPTTIKFNLYGQALAKKGIKVYYSPTEIQELHESIIRNMVSGEKNPDQIKKLGILTKRFVNKNNLDGVILGCTELPLVFPKKHFSNVIDCMDILADKLLEKYYDIPEE
jgi:aspartate racemase